VVDEGATWSDRADHAGDAERGEGADPAGVGVRDLTFIDSSGIQLSQRSWGNAGRANDQAAAEIVVERQLRA
jgi:hypothetical protein